MYARAAEGEGDRPPPQMRRDRHKVIGLDGLSHHRAVRPLCTVTAAVGVGVGVVVLLLVLEDM